MNVSINPDHVATCVLSKATSWNESCEEFFNFLFSLGLNERALRFESVEGQNPFERKIKICTVDPIRFGILRYRLIVSPLIAAFGNLDHESTSVPRELVVRVFFRVPVSFHR